MSLLLPPVRFRYLKTFMLRTVDSATHHIHHKSFGKRSVNQQHEHKDRLLQAKPLPVFRHAPTVVLRQTLKNQNLLMFSFAFCSFL